MKKQKLIIGVIIIVFILIVFGAAVYFFVQFREEQSFEYELNKPSKVTKLPNDIPIYPGARSHSYSLTRYKFITKGSVADILKYYNDYFSSINSRYIIVHKRWCAGAQAMFCSYMVDELVITDPDIPQQKEVVIVDVGPYKSGTYFTLDFSKNH